MNKILFPVICLFFGLMGSVAEASIQGTLGATSTALINVQFTVGREVRVFRLDDVSLGTYDLSQPTQSVDDVFCIYDNAAAFGMGTYSVTFNSTNSPGNFQLAFGGNNVPYQVSFADNDTGAGITSVAAGVPLSGNGGASSSSTACTPTGGSDNATVRVTVLKADAQSAPDGTYSDILTVLVTPDP